MEQYYPGRSLEESLLEPRVHGLMELLASLFEKNLKKVNGLGVASSGSKILPLYDLVHQDFPENTRGWHFANHYRNALQFRDGVTGVLVIVKHMPPSPKRQFASSANTKHQRGLFTQPNEDDTMPDLFGGLVAPETCLVIQWSVSQSGVVELMAYKPKTPGSYREDPEIWYTISRPVMGQTVAFRSRQSAPMLYGNDEFTVRGPKTFGSDSQ